MKSVFRSSRAFVRAVHRSIKTSIATDVTSGLQARPHCTRSRLGARLRPADVGGLAVNCTSCSGDIEADSRFCRHCGLAVSSGGQAQPRQIEPPQIATAESEESSPARKSDSLFQAALAIGGLSLAVIFIILLLPRPTTQQSTSTQFTGNDAAAAASAAADAASEAAAAASEAIGVTDRTQNSSTGWSYRTKEDKVRGGTTYYATLTSSNRVFQSPPYESDTSMDMTVRHAPGSGTNIMLSVSSGQLMCPSYEGCSGTVRFDEGPAERISFEGAADNSSETIFVSNEASFLAKLKKSKRVIIEKTMYQAGNPQFEFDVAGLNWDH